MAVPGDIAFNTFTIGSLDLLNPAQATFNYLDIYEDILRPIFVAEVEVLDYNDVLGTYMINGKEDVNLSFNVPGADSVNFAFSLMQNKHLDDKTQQNSGSLKYKTYKLRMVSKDILNNQSTHLAKSFNQPTHLTVQQSLQTISNAQINVPDPTKGNQRLVANYTKVYDFLNSIHDRHVSSQYNSSLYTLFAARNGGTENRTFCTFEYLMNQSSVFNFKQDPSIGTRTTTESDSMNNMLWFKAPDSFNTPVVYNAPSNKHVYNALVGKSSSTNVPASSINNPLGQSITDSLISEPNSSKTPPKRSTHVDASLDVSATGIATAKVNRANFIKDLSQNSAKFEINGNPNISVGQVVTLNIPKKADADQSSGENQMNDKVLITKIRHKIMPASVKPRYTMIVEAIKAGFYQPVN